MIKSTKIKRYRKLKDITFSFSKHVNVISGTNRTCKTSLLHLISNSVKKLNKKCAWIKNLHCLDIIRGVNNTLNLKVETLTKGDKEYNNPAPGYKGTLFTVSYFNSNLLEFCRHFSSTMTRYAIKPWYNRNTKDFLPFCPVIYLGLFRLFAFGEFQDDKALSAINKSFPESYQQELIKIYKDFTRYEIFTLAPQLMGNIKKRTEFASNVPGIDSNTISAGEYNLMIILMGLIISLRMYYENITSANDVESILLIDDLDATLHPYFQVKLLDLFMRYSKAYKIQVLFTTHRLSLLEESLKRKESCHIEYLVDGITNVIQMPSPDIYKIKLDLNGKLKRDVYGDVCIPIFTEDTESRLFIHILFDAISKQDVSFYKLRRLFYMLELYIGAENLRKMFFDSKIVSKTIRSICILDGDQKQDLNNYIITLPGGKSPEMVAFKHLQTLIISEDNFWESDFVFSSRYSKPTCIGKVVPRIQSIEAKNASLNEKGETTKRQRCKKNKEVFNAFIDLFEVVLID